MRKLFTLATAVTIAAMTQSAAYAETFVKGVVEKVDRKAGKITIAHEDLVDLNMPAMTMIFYPAEASMLETLKEGTQIEFVATQVNGRLTVAKIK